MRWDRSRVRKTAKERVAELRADPEHQAWEEANDPWIAQARAEYARAAAPVLADLAEGRYHVSSVGQLVHEFQKTGRRYESAVPILIRWLPRVTYRPLHDDIVGTLSVPWARREGTRPLIEWFRSCRRTKARPRPIPAGWWATPLKSLPTRRSPTSCWSSHRTGGTARRARWSSSASPSSRRTSARSPCCWPCSTDPDVTGSAIMALGKLKAVKARDRLQQFLDHPEPFYRKEARKALNKIK
jgi:hypothetical protein